MRPLLTSLILAISCSLHTCATTTAELMSGKEVSVSMGADGKPQFGITFPAK